jgi:large subunit ribosomal protein L16
MGLGKGSPEYWVYVVKSNRILYEISGVPETIARAAMKIAAYKMPIVLNLLLLYPIKVCVMGRDK